MIPLVLAARELGRALVAVWRDPETKALPVVAGALVLTGTLFYWRFEDWSFIESLYFLTGFGVLVALLTAVAQQYMQHKAEPGRARARIQARRHRGDGPTDEDPTAA